MASTIFRLRDYRLWFAGDTASGVAQAMRGLVVPLLAYRMTGSVVAAGALGTAVQAVSLFFMVPGGVIVDRIDRRRLIQLYALVGIGCWGVLSLLLWTGRATFPLLCLLTLVAAVSGGLFGHATDAALRTIVPSSEYPSAMAANQGRDAALQLGASPAAGALYAVRDFLPGVVMAAGYAVLLATVRMIRAELVPRRSDVGPVLSELTSGFAVVWRDLGKRSILLMLLLVNLGVTGLLYIVQIGMISKGTRPGLVGLLDTFAAIGSLAGAVIAGKIVQRIPTGRLVAFGLAWICVGLVPLAVSSSLFVALPVLVWVTLAIPAINSGLVGFFFGTTPDHLQGRVGSVMSVATSGLAAAAPLVGGLSLAHLGYQVSAVGCLVVIATSAVVGLVSRSVRSIPRPSEWETTDHANEQQQA